MQAGSTALHFAAESGKTECVKLLLEKGAKVDYADKVSGALHKSPVWAALCFTRCLNAPLLCAEWLYSPI